MFIFLVLIAMGRGEEVSVLGYKPNNKRVALVIGNDRYAGEAALGMAARNAASFGKAIQGPGYEFALQLPLDPFSQDAVCANQTIVQMRQLIQAFGKETEGAKTALFYFSGHVAQLLQDQNGMASKRNYLLGINKRGGQESIPEYGIALDEIAKVMKAKGNIIVLDCAYTNGRTLAQPDRHRMPGSEYLPGLAAFEPPAHCVVALPSKPGIEIPPMETDGLSYYTSALLASLYLGDSTSVFDEVRVRIPALLKKDIVEIGTLDWVPMEYAAPKTTVNFLNVISPQDGPLPPKTVRMKSPAEEDRSVSPANPPVVERLSKPSGAQEMHALGLSGKLDADLARQIAKGDRLLAAGFWTGEGGAIRYLLVTKQTILHNEAPPELFARVERKASKVESIFAGPEDRWIVTYTDGSFDFSANTDITLIAELSKIKAPQRLGCVTMGKQAYYLHLVDEQGLYAGQIHRQIPGTFLNDMRGLLEARRFVTGVGFSFSGPVFFILHGKNQALLSPFFPKNFRAKIEDLQRNGVRIEQMYFLPGENGYLILSSRN